MSDNYASSYAKVLEVLADSGIDVEGGTGAPHSWRCEYFWESAGPCTCIEDLIWDIHLVLGVTDG